MWPFREKILDSGGVVTIEGEERKRKPSTYYVVPCMFIFMAYTFMCIPLLQESVILLNCNNYYLDANGHNTTSPYPIEISNDDRCDKSEISSSANKWYMYLSASSSAVSIFTTGTLGAITDKYGRRLAMILPCLGAMAQAAIIVILTHLDMSLPYYFIPQLLLGLTGGATTFLMACFSYSADCSNLSKRSLEIGLLEAAMFLGGTVGPISEGYLVELYNVDVPLITFAGALVPVVIWILWIPESLPPSRKVASVSWKKANIFGALSILFSPSVYGDRW